MQHLQDVMTNAANDDPKALTADIEAAIKALQDAVTAATNNRDSAVTDANNLISKTAPVSNEPGVATALQALRDAVKTGTAAEILEATAKLQDALDAANTSRNTANDAGKQAITDANASAVATDPSVAAAMQHLQDVMTNAANDDPKALTADIEAAMKALQDAVTAATSDRESAVTDANNLISKTAPVSNESGVATAMQALSDAVKTGTAAEIREATAKLQDALDAANAARNTANDAGKQAITNANASAVATDPAVAAAMQHLQDVMTNAANDDPKALTADIEAAIKALQDAVTNANNQGSGEQPTDNTPGETEPGTTLPDPVTTVPAPGKTPEPVDVMPSVPASDAPIQLVENSQPQIVASAFGPGSVQLPDTAADGQRQNWHTVSLGIYLFSTMFLLGATKRRKNEDEN